MRRWPPAPRVALRGCVPADERAEPLAAFGQASECRQVGRFVPWQGVMLLARRNQGIRFGQRHAEPHAVLRGRAVAGRDELPLPRIAGEEQQRPPPIKLAPLGEQPLHGPVRQVDA